VSFKGPAVSWMHLRLKEMELRKISLMWQGQKQIFLSEATLRNKRRNIDNIARFQGQIRGFQIGPMHLENIPPAQRNKQKDLGFCGLFNYKVIQVYI
jgi:hypothetical protein